MTQVKTFCTRCRIEKEGWDYIWPAAVVSRNKFLPKWQRLVWPYRQGQAQPELNSRGWQRLQGRLSYHLGRAVGTFLGCERSSQQWDLSELHWCAFSPWALLIFIFTCHWPGNISASIERQFPVLSCPSCIYIARTESGAAVLEGWSDSGVLAGPFVFSGMH